MSGYAQDNIRLPPKWIALNLSKRECSTFIPLSGDLTICHCGRRKIDHGDFVKFNHRADKWSPLLHTRNFPTDAYGTILFEGEHHPNKAHYVRLSYDTNPERVMHLMRYVWGLPMPKLVISVHGGSLNFDLSTRLGKVFQTGIINVAQTTSAWVLSSGLNSGVSKHLGNALNNRWFGGYKHRNVVSIGIAPWGMCEHRMELIGRNKERIYSPLEIHNSNMIHLNPRHSNFLLVDNGSIGKFGGETFLRRKLEKCISTYPLSQNGNCANCTIPVVVIIMEGGGHTLRLISEYLYDDPPIPIILFAGTGKVTDLVAWMLKRFQTIEEFQACSEDIKCKIERIFHLGAQASSEVFQELNQIYQRKIMITVYNGNSASEEEFDTVILSSIFRSQHWSPLEQLELTLVWNRVDLAKYEVFVYGREWSRGHLEEAMMEALVSNRLEFVELLMEHGINMKTFLTVERLEKLYSTEERATIIGSLLMEFSDLRRISKRRRKLNHHDRHLSLSGIGAALIQMGVYRPDYLQMKARIIKDLNGAMNVDEEKIREQRFSQPFDDLFLWAVLTKRQDLAKLLWTHGQGALAKALVAAMLNKFLAQEITRMNISLVKEFENNRNEWNKLSLSLLDSCYRQDFKLARQLLTMELKNWSQLNCLTLAFMADHKTLLGHPCCQILMADWWMGALNLKSNSTFKITLATIFPPFAFFLQYKSTEELKVSLIKENDDDRRDRDNDNNLDKHKQETRNQEIMVPDSESIRTYHPEKSTETVSNTLRSRYKSGRKTNLSEVVSKLELGKRTTTSTVETTVHPDHDKVAKKDSKHQTPIVTIVDTKGEQKHSSNDPGNNDHCKLSGPVEQFERFSQFVTTQQTLKAYQKFIECQKAPITNFIRHALGYLVFIVCMWYVVLYNQDPNAMGWVELYVTLFVCTHTLECVREFITIDALTFSKKMVEMKENKWGLTDFFICLFFLSGTALRFMDGYFDYGMVIYRASSIYWNLRIYKYLAAHRFVGPKLLMITRMCSHMVYFAMIILVVIFAFAIARESIRSPYSDPTWKDLKPSFLEPYVMMFGEVDPLEEVINVDCIDQINNVSEECPRGAWLIPIFWVVYMMISNILIVNVLIAVFNGIYAEIDSNSVEIWMSQQFLVVMEFTKKPPLFPPFIIICHILSIIQFIYSKCQRCMCNQELLEQSEDDEQIHVITGNDHSHKAFLDPAEQEIVFDFEEDNVDLLRHILTTDKDRKPPQGASLFGNAETAYRVGMASDKSSIHELKKQLQELYTELESQRQKIDKLVEYWEMEAANQKVKEEGLEADDDDDDDEDSTSDSSIAQ